MEFEDANYEFHSEDQFWAALDETLSHECETHSHIDDVLRSYLNVIIEYKDQFDESEYLLARCAYKLAASSLFAQNADYIRRQFVYSLLQEDDCDLLQITTSFLLADARSTEHTFKLLVDEGAFPRLVQLIPSQDVSDHETLHRLLMELLYEMSRIQKISSNDLESVNDEFVCSLFNIIERVSNDVTDPYHYPVIRVVLVLNEQFMVAAHDPEHSKSSILLTNKILKVLSTHGSKYKTFGENIILLLNREDETSLQLLTLKLLYLLFTTPPTYEYFYTNDLRVLVDILIRNLLDLPEEASALRHTYLRVLFPLLEHTQLQHPPHYKRNEIQKLLTVLGGEQVLDSQDGEGSLNHWTHFDAIDETTKRLVKRCKTVNWLIDEVEQPTRSQSPTDEANSPTASPSSPSKPQPPALPAPRKLKKRNSSKASTLTIGQYLAPQLESARQSSLSMMEMAVQKEKPGVITPSRNPSLKHGLRAAVAHNHHKEKPPVPKARRSGWSHMKMLERTNTEIAITNTGSEEHLAAKETQQRLDPPADEKREESESPTETRKQEERESKDNSEEPPMPAPKQAKKPPPAPRARRWRGKRAQEDEEVGGTARQPGKFDTSLPSIKTETVGNALEQSPFSPAEEQKTLSPVSERKAFSPQSASTDEATDEKRLNSVSEALGQAQEMAVRDIADTLESVEIKDDKAVLQCEHQAPPQQKPPRPALETKPIFQPPPVPKQRQDTASESARTLGQTTSASSPEDVDHTQPQIEVTPPSRAVLAPPNPAPIRGVPGPQWQLERSPFRDEGSSDEGNDEK